MSDILGLLNRFSNYKILEEWIVRKAKWITLLLICAMAISLLAGCDNSETKAPTFTVEYMDGDTVLKTEEVQENGVATEWAPERRGRPSWAGSPPRP